MRRATAKVKVLGFDSWTKGAHHFERLVPALRRHGMALKVVHLGAWGNDPGRSPTEQHGQLELADIASYPSSSLRAVVEREKPDVVVLLSTTTFAHRALIRHCRSMGIPTLNLYHGMSTTWFDPSTRSGFQPNMLGHFKIVISKFYKTLRFTLPCYLRALVATGASLADWGRFVIDVANLAIGRQPTRAADDARTTLCAVYTQPDVEHAMRSFGFRREEVFVVGNPDLTRFRLALEHIGSRLREPAQPRQFIMYIDTAMQPNGLVYPNVKAFVEHLKQTVAGVAAAGLRLMLKLHPANDMDRVRALLADQGVEFVDNDNFVEKLLSCEAAIVETTTLAMIPALIGMPILLARFGALRDLKFGSALTSYPRARFLRQVRDLPLLLGEVHAGADHDTTERWIAASAGPLPAESMPERVAALLDRLACDGEHSSTCNTAAGRRVLPNGERVCSKVERAPERDS